MGHGVSVKSPLCCPHILDLLNSAKKKRGMALHWEMPQLCGTCTAVLISTSSYIICLMSRIQNWQLESAA